MYAGEATQCIADSDNEGGPSQESTNGEKTADEASNPDKRSLDGASFINASRRIALRPQV